METRFLIHAWTPPEGHGYIQHHWVECLKDFEFCQNGIPDTDYEGGVWAIYLVFVACDLGCYCNTYGIPHFNAGSEICGSCLCNRTSLPWTDMRADAQWRRTTIISKSQYISRIRQPFHPLVSSSFFCQSMLQYDAMHVLDHNGQPVSSCTWSAESVR